MQVAPYRHLERFCLGRAANRGPLQTVKIFFRKSLQNTGQMPKFVKAVRAVRAVD
mgnify:CR=1 FL=1